MTDTQLAQCNAIINTATAACTAVGDGIAPITQSAIAVTMVIELGTAFGMAITESEAKGIIAEVSDSGRFLISQCLTGCVINAKTVAKITECIGQLVAHKFDSEASQRIEKGNDE